MGRRLGTVLIRASRTSHNDLVATRMEFEDATLGLWMASDLLSGFAQSSALMGRRIDLSQFNLV